MHEMTRLPGDAVIRAPFAGETFRFKDDAAVLEQKDGVYKVIENPLAKTAPLVLKKSDIASRAKSPTSIMPKGLLDKLTHEEILDLVAYVSSGGNEKHPLFQGGHAHEHHH